MRKWRRIGHTLRKEDESIEEQAGLEFAGSRKDRKDAENPEMTVFELAERSGKTRNEFCGNNIGLRSLTIALSS